MEDIRGYIGPVAQSKLSKNPPKRDGDIFIALLPPHKHPKDCDSDDLLLLTSNHNKTVGSVTRWFHKVTGFTVQLVYSDTFLPDNLELGSLAYHSRDCMVALWAVLQHPQTNSTSVLNIQETTTTLSNQLTPASPAKLSVQEHLVASVDKFAPSSGQKPRFKYAEAFPTPPGVNDAAWNKLYTAANARMYYKASNSAAIAKSFRTSGETYQLALTMLAEKQGISGGQKDYGQREKSVVHQSITHIAPSYQANGINVSKSPVAAAALDRLAPSQGAHESATSQQLGREILPRREAVDKVPVEKWEPGSRTIIQQQASAILRPASTQPDIAESKGTTLVERDPVLKMLATEASIDASLKELIVRVASSVASADEQVQLQARYEYLESLRDERHTRRPVTLLHPTRSSQSHSVDSEEGPEEAVRAMCSIEGDVYT